MSGYNTVSMKNLLMMVSVLIVFFPLFILSCNDGTVEAGVITGMLVALAIWGVVYWVNRQFVVSYERLTLWSLYVKHEKNPNYSLNIVANNGLYVGITFKDPNSWGSRWKPLTLKLVTRFLGSDVSL